MSTKTIPVKLYMSADDYLAAKAKCDAAGISMSSAGSLLFRQCRPAHITRRHADKDMPTLALRRGLTLPGSRLRRGGAPRPHLRV